MSDIPNIPTINPQEFSVKAQEIYKKVKEEMEKNHRGEFIAIEPESADYFLGKDQMEAVNKAKEKYPQKIFYLLRIGHEAVTTMSSHFKPVAYGSIF